MRVAVVTFDGFNELDSLVAAHIINRVNRPGWRAEITGPSELITSMNGVMVRTQQPLEFAARADAVIIGSGIKTREVVDDENTDVALATRSGASIHSVAVLGSLAADPARARREDAGMYRPLDTGMGRSGGISGVGPAVLRARARGDGRRMPRLALLGRLADLGRRGQLAAIDALSYVLPHGEEDEYTRRALRQVEPFLSDALYQEAPLNMAR